MIQTSIGKPAGHLKQIYGDAEESRVGKSFITSNKLGRLFLFLLDK